MHFLYPGFLFALFALLIPIIVHLFNFRKFKKVYFTNVKFLREIRQDTQSKSKLKHLLILISRLLAVAFLVFAFAQPYIPVNDKIAQAGMKKVSVFIDNSFSMEATGKNGSLLETARKKAREIASAYNPSDRFQLLTADFEARHQRLLSRDEFLELVDEVQPGSSTRNLSEIVQRQSEAVLSGEKGVSAVSYIISDFQKSQGEDPLSVDSSLQVFLVPLEAVRQNNLYIDTCFLSTPFVQLNVPNELNVVIKNKGNEKVENIPLRLVINGVQKAIASIHAESNSETEVKMYFTLTEAGWQQAVLSVTDYPVTFDDNFYFTFNLKKNLDILSVNGKEISQSLTAVFSNDEYFRMRNNPASQVDYSSFSSTRMILLNEVVSFSSGMIHELEGYVKKGGTVFLIPSEEADLFSYNELMNVFAADNFQQLVSLPDKVISIEAKNELFDGVFEKGKTLPENMDLPVLSSYYQFSRHSRNRSETIMKLQSGTPFLFSVNAGKGKLYALASSLNPDAGSFARHALFVPVFIRAALLGSTEILEPMVIGRDNSFTISDTLVSNDNIFHLSNASLEFDIIPESKLLNSNSIITVHNQLKKAQNYELTSSGKTISAIAFNYDRKESDLSVISGDELEKLAEEAGNTNVSVIEPGANDLSHSISRLNEGKRLWKYCILAVLFFLGVEIFLIRYFRRSST
jgi:hypothetical protein